MENYWTGGCGEAFCDDDITPFAQGRAIGRDVPDSEGSLMASYSVYVVDPGAAPRNFSLDSSSSSWADYYLSHRHWKSRHRLNLLLSLEK